jgi:hypothetical protein
MCGSAFHCNPNGYTPLDGIIGGDVLSMFDVDLDLGRKSITFYEVHGCAHVTPPWAGPFASVPIKVTSRHNIVVPVEVDGSLSTIPCELKIRSRYCRQLAK